MAESVEDTDVVWPSVVPCKLEAIIGIVLCTEVLCTEVLCTEVLCTEVLCTEALFVWVVELAGEIDTVRIFAVWGLDET